MTRGIRWVGGKLGKAFAPVRQRAAARPPWERSVIDDVAMKRPWNLVVKVVRLVALLRVPRLRAGVTVVIVNWNTRDVVIDVLAAVRSFSPASVDVLVIDNGSTDGSWETLRSIRSVRSIRLPSNAGHGVALDIALGLSRTKVAVTIDSDAIPLSHGWMDCLLDPMCTRGAMLVGQRAKRGFVHPMFLAVDVEAFVRRRWSFQVHRRPGVSTESSEWGLDAWDTGELLTSRLAPSEIAFVERTENGAPGLPGMTSAGVVYHHGGVSRSANGAVTSEAFALWRSACGQLGLDLGGLRTHLLAS